MLQNVDYNFVGSFTRREASDAHHSGHLSNGDIYSRSSHEGRDGGEGDQFNNPSKSSETKEKHDGSTNDGQRRGYDVCGNIGDLFLGLENDVSGNSREHGDGTDGDILGCCEEPVDKHTHEGRVQAEFGFKVGKLGICHALRYNNGADSDACGKVRDEMSGQTKSKLTSH